MKFSEKLQLARKRAGLEQQELADLVGVSRVTIGNWENNKANIRLKYMKILCKSLNVPHDYFASSIEQVEKLSMPAEKGKLPVVGVAQAGKGIFSGDGDYPNGAADEYISRPHGVKDVNAFGVIVKDRSMTPAIRPQQRVIVSPNVTLENSDRAVVGLKNGRKLVAEWHKDKDRVKLVKYNDEDITVKIDEIDFAYKIVWIREL